MEIARVLLFQHHFCPCLLVGEFVEILFGVETEEKHLLMSPAFLTVRNAVVSASVSMWERLRLSKIAVFSDFKALCWEEVISIG